MTPSTRDTSIGRPMGAGAAGDHESGLPIAPRLRLVSLQLSPTEVLSYNMLFALDGETYEARARRVEGEWVFAPSGPLSDAITLYSTDDTPSEQMSEYQAHVFSLASAALRLYQSLDDAGVLDGVPVPVRH